MIYACDYCYFLFSYAGSVDRCPDCGKKRIRLATEEEIHEFQEREKTDLWKEQG